MGQSVSGHMHNLVKHLWHESASDGKAGTMIVVDPVNESSADMLLNTLGPGLLCGLVLAGLAYFRFGWGLFPSIVTLVVAANVVAVLIAVFCRSRRR